MPLTTVGQYEHAGQRLGRSADDPQISSLRAVRRLAVAGIATVWLSVPWSAPLGPAAAAGRATGARLDSSAAAGVAEEHRAAVIIDTGTMVKSVCVRFREDAISGIDALARAQVDPVLQAFSGKGAAVCALCGVGCPAGDSCLTCNPDGKFWSYSRAPAGTTGLRTAGVGASSTTVRDGDVEGWRWALGGTPPFSTVEEVCGETAPLSTSTTGTPVPGSVVTTPGSVGPSTSSAPTTEPVTATTRAPGRTTTTAAAAAPTTGPEGAAPPSEAGEPSTSAPTTRPTMSPSGLAASRTSPGRDGGSGSGWPGLVVFGAVLVGLVGWGAAARRARRNIGPPG